MQVAFACATVRCLRLDHEGKRELGKFDDLFISSLEFVVFFVIFLV